MGLTRWTRAPLPNKTRASGVGALGPHAQQPQARSAEDDSGVASSEQQAPKNQGKWGWGLRILHIFLALTGIL